MFLTRSVNFGLVVDGYGQLVHTSTLHTARTGVVQMSSVEPDERLKGVSETDVAGLELRPLAKDQG